MICTCDDRIFLLGVPIHGQLTGYVGIPVHKTAIILKNSIHINRFIINELERGEQKTKKLSKINGF